MANIGTLAVRIIAVTGDFDNKIRHVKTQLGGLGGAAVLGAFAAGIGAFTAIGVTALAKMVEEGEKAAWTITRMARTWGVSTEAAATFYSMSERLNIPLNKLTAWLNHFTQQLGQAQIAGSAASRTFQMFGIDAVEIANTPMDKAFVRTIEAIRKLPTAGEQARAAFQLFGRSGVEAMDIVRMGAAGFEKWKAEAKEAGLAFNEIDGNKIVLAQGAMSRLMMSLHGLGVQMAIELAPLLIGISDSIREWFASTGGAKAWAQTITQIFVFIAGFIQNMGQGLQLTFLTVKASLLSIINAIEISLEMMLLKIREIALATGMGMAAGKGFQEGNNKLNEHITFLKEHANDTWEDVNKIVVAKPGTQQWQEWFEELKIKAEKTAKEMSEKMKHGMGSGLSEIARMQDEIEKGFKLDEKFRAPVDQLLDYKLELDSMLKDGALGFDKADGERVYDAALTEKFRELDKEEHKAKLAPVMLKDSREAVGTITRNRTRSSGESAAERVEVFIREQTALQRDMRRFAKETAEALRNLKPTRLP